jgi:hypothetical protein
MSNAAKARNLQKKIDQEGPQELSKEDWITSDPSLVEYGSACALSLTARWRVLKVSQCQRTELTHCPHRVPRITWFNLTATNVPFKAPAKLAFPLSPFGMLVWHIQERPSLAKKFS